MSRLTSVSSSLARSSASPLTRRPRPRSLQRENEEGKQLMFAEQVRGGERRSSSDAVARVPEAKYFFNLCTSLLQEGKFGEALTACNAADKNADDKLKAKVAKLGEQDQRARRRSRARRAARPAAAAAANERPADPSGTPPIRTAGGTGNPAAERRHRAVAGAPAWRSAARRRRACSSASKPEQQVHVGARRRFLRRRRPDRPAGLLRQRRPAASGSRATTC